MPSIPRVGTEFAGYRIEAQLGRGGMSVVYRAENSRLGNRVALKLIAPELAQDEKFRERFVRESRVAAGLNHPNVIPIYDAGDEEDLLYIAMRYVPYLDLKGLIQHDAPFSLDQSISIVAQVASALDAAHAQGLIHRDVKPANILVEPRAERDLNHHVYLSDFGLTKHSASESGLTGTGLFVGTVDYVSPEQVRGEPIDGRTDIYSLGCVLFECLTGVPPYRKDEDYAVLFAHAQEAPPSATALRPELPTAIDDVLAKALAKAPDERYQSGAELVSALRDAAVSATPVAQPVPPATVPPPPEPPPVAAPDLGAAEPRRRRIRAPRGALVGLVGLLVGALVAAVVAYALVRDEGGPTGAAGVAQGALALEAVVPKAVWDHCVSTTARAGALETAVCLPPAKAAAGGGVQPDRLEVSLFASSTPAKRAYAAQVERSGIKRQSGACSGTSWGGEGRWVHGPGKPGGSRVCFFEGDSTFIAWTHEGFGQATHKDVLGIAEVVGIDHAGLFAWWNVWVHKIGKLRGA
jgi:protein kinase-like protein